jgi:hypothetical protein
MSLQWAGLTLSAATFGTIACGHILVRRLHPKWGTKPGIPLMLLGLVLMVISIFFDSNLISGVLGIVGITTIWDGIEFYRQEKRVQRGHA